MKNLKSYGRVMEKLFFNLDISQILPNVLYTAPLQHAELWIEDKHGCWFLSTTTCNIESLSEYDQYLHNTCL